MKILSVSLIFALNLTGCYTHPAPALVGSFSGTELQQFSALNPIDAHAHIFISDPEFYATLNKLNLRVLDILLVDNTNLVRSNLSIEDQNAWQFVHGANGRASLCTTFDPYQITQPNFSETAIHQINQEFDRGAVAVKIWKNIGMELKNSDGTYILPDDPRFQPIYRDIVAHNKTLIAHLADPNSSWESPNFDSPDANYYDANPQWYMYTQARAPSKGQILQARDHLLEQNKDLRVVGAHLGSEESDFGELGQRLDRYPNFAVDLAGRLAYIAMRPRAQMIAFFTQYQDRLIYGTDTEYGFGEPQVNGVRTPWENVYARDWRFLATDDKLNIGGQTVHGLALPRSILLKLYHDNAVRWYPGISTIH